MRDGCCRRNKLVILDEVLHQQVVAKISLPVNALLGSIFYGTLINVFLKITMQFIFAQCMELRYLSHAILAELQL